MFGWLLLSSLALASYRCGKVKRLYSPRDDECGKPNPCDFLIKHYHTLSRPYANFFFTSRIEMTSAVSKPL